MRGGSGLRTRLRIGLTIKALRRSRKMTQQGLAAAIGRHVNTVARWEGSGIEPGHAALPLIAAVFRKSAKRSDVDRLLSDANADDEDGVRLVADLQQTRLSPS